MDEEEDAQMLFEHEASTVPDYDDISFRLTDDYLKWHRLRETAIRAGRDTETLRNRVAFLGRALMIIQGREDAITR